MAKIFLSYRREDSGGYAGRIQDRLTRELGPNALFMDVDSIPIGRNFVKVLQDAVANCEVLFAVIGRNWLDALDETGNRRLDDPNDFVRIEIRAALQRDIPLVPILLEGAKIPNSRQLPKDLKDLSVRNGVEVRHSSFHSDVDRLVQRLKNELNITSDTVEAERNESRAVVSAPLPVVTEPGGEESRGGPTGSRRLEKIIETADTQVPIAYFEMAVVRARSVGRVVVHVGGAPHSFGTGFLTKDNVLVTAHHVLPDAERALSAIVQFNYQQTLEGLEASVKAYRVSPNSYFKTDQGDDWTVVQLEGNPNEMWGALPLSKSNPKIGDHVNIIHHPHGGPKQIAYSGNVITYVGKGRVQYITSTSPGSSGSPIFDKEWNVIAFHSAGGMLNEPDGPSTLRYFRNQGIIIDVVAKALT